jgi:hypothetical protein
MTSPARPRISAPSNAGVRCCIRAARAAHRGPDRIPVHYPIRRVGDAVLEHHGRNLREHRSGCRAGGAVGIGERCAGGDDEFYDLRQRPDGRRDRLGNRDGGSAVHWSAQRADGPHGAQAVTSTRIDLRWTDTAADETGFQVQRSTDAVSFVRIATFGPNQQAYANTGLKQNRTYYYYYRVRAYSAAGASAYSNIATAKTSRK